MNASEPSIAIIIFENFEFDADKLNNIRTLDQSFKGDYSYSCNLI